MGDVVKYEPRQIDKIVESVPSSQNGIETALAMGYAINELRAAFDQPEIKSIVDGLYNSRLGFVVDQPQKYGWDVVKTAVIEALLSGYRLVGNEWNIIGGRMYPALAGKFRKITEFPRLSDFEPNAIPPEKFDTEERHGYKGRETVTFARVKCFATWNLNGKEHGIGIKNDLVFKIRVNAGMSDDAVIGKALSHLYGRVLTLLTGVSVPFSTDVSEVVDVTPAHDENIMTPNEMRAERNLPPIEEVAEPRNIAELQKPEPEPKAKKEKFKAPRICVNPSCPELDRDGLHLSGCASPDPEKKDPDSPFVGKCKLFVQGHPNAVASGIDRDKVEAAKKELGIAKMAETDEEKWAVIMKVKEMGGAK